MGCGQSTGAPKPGGSGGPGLLHGPGYLASCAVHLETGTKGTCQDAVLVCDNFLGKKGDVLCGVFDGHGTMGHRIAELVRDELPKKLRAALKGAEEEIEKGEATQAWESWEAGGGRATAEGAAAGGAEGKGAGGAREEGGAGAGEGEGVSSSPLPPSDKDSKEPLVVRWRRALYRDAYRKAYAEMDERVKEVGQKDAQDSGCTAVTVLRQGSSLIIANVGDSRCILGASKAVGLGVDQCLEAIQITKDHKPGEPAERARIHRAGGRVMRLMNTIDRVFLPTEFEPGLATARAFGDYDVKPYGVVSEPELTFREVSSRDRFLVLASDGVWDALPNGRVVQLVADTSLRSRSAKSVVKASMAGWEKDRPKLPRDDISTVVMFL